MAELTNVLEKEKKPAKKFIRSPLFYVGDKYKLMPQLNGLFPKQIDKYYDVFCGGASSSMNVKASSYYLNDIDEKIIELHKHLQKSSKDMAAFIDKMHGMINAYGLSLSELGKNEEIEILKKKYIKTYFARFNKEPYLKLRNDYNNDQSNLDLLYLLLIYGFNHMIRFNRQGKFNLPVGNVDWNKNVTSALENYADWYNNNRVYISRGLDFENFVRKQNLTDKDFLYFDPPYLITFSDYNKLWNEKEEKRLYSLLDDLDSKGIKWGFSNMLAHKGNVNGLLLSWAEGYTKYSIESNYISRFDNTIKKNSKEIYVTNLS